MALRLIIISSQKAELGERATMLIDQAGGTIGRAEDNAWVLPDANRYISAHHARISYRNGSYVVEDTSTNGLYLNDSPDPVGRLGPQPLRPGDTLRLGAYCVAVQDSNRPAIEASAIVSFSAPAAADEDGLQRDIGVDLSISELLMNNVDLSAARRAFDPRSNPAGSSSPAAPTALEAFCRGAGMNHHRLPAEGQERLLQLAGLLLREALVGIKELARTQREIRQDSGLQAPADEPERLALQSLPVEDLLVRLLLGHEPQKLDAVQWLRELFALASRHDAALMRALRPALREFTQRLDPALLSPGSPASERFRSITDMPGGRLPHLFAEALARTFNAEIGPGPGEVPMRANAGAGRT